MRTARLALVGLLITACGGTVAPPRSTPPGRVTVKPAEQLPSFSGNTEQETDRFHLSGGDYKVQWTARANDSACFFSAFLDGPGFEDIVSADVETSESGTANLHDVEAGEWFVNVTSHCQWTIRFAR